jgi:hypothetical protein
LSWDTLIAGGVHERKFVSTALQTYETRDGRWLRTATCGNLVEDE